MNKTILAGAIALLFSPGIHADTPQTDEVVVTANRISQNKDSVLADVTVISREEIARAGQSTFVELLQTQPGVEVSSSGGAGKASSVYLRGANSDHVVVLVDGLRVNSATLGTTAFENIPLAQIERIEILRGPSTSLYGQDAIGGVIQIFTRKNAGTPRFDAALGYGTWDTRTASAGFGGSMNDTTFSLRASSLDTRGISALKTRNPNLSDRDGYNNLAVSGQISQRLAAGHDLSLQFFSSEGHTRYDSSSNLDPSFAFNPAFSNHADLNQLGYSVTSKNQFTGNWLSTLKIGEGKDRSVDYAAPGPFSPLSRSVTSTDQFQLTWQNDLSLPIGRLSLLYDNLRQRVSGTTEYDRDSRNNDGFVVNYLLDAGPHSLQASLRNDHNTQYGTHTTGGIGYGFSVTPNWRVTANYGSAFKAPSFNQLYFPFFGNPNLKPEQSDNLEASLRYQDTQSTASLTVYENKVRDLINTVQIDQFTFAPLNVAKATLRGLTLAASQRWDDWSLRGSIDLQSPKNEETDKLLAYRAQRHGSLVLSRNLGNWRFGSEYIVSSQRYSDAANEVRLAGYGLLNVTTDYRINADWKLQARVNNLLDKNYALTFDGNPSNGGFIYNTPGINGFLSVVYTPGN